jgi:hypothetical protein
MQIICPSARRCELREYLFPSLRHCFLRGFSAWTTEYNQLASSIIALLNCLVLKVPFQKLLIFFRHVGHRLSLHCWIVSQVSLRTAAGLLLRSKPFLHSGSPIKHSATEACPCRSGTKRMPTIERAHVSPQFGGEFLLRQKI